MAKAKKAGYMISAVAEQFQVHPQTLRMYEREGLLTPSRSDGNTRLYTPEDLERLDVIIKLTRDLGVNLAGVEIILNMRAKMDEMRHEFERFFEYLKDHASEFSAQNSGFAASEALIPVSRSRMIRVRETHPTEE